MRHTAEVVADVRADVGESPSWDPATGTLLFVDVTPGAVYRWSPATGRTTRFHVGRSIGAVVPRSDGDLTLACEEGIFVSGPAGEDLRLVVPVEQDVPGNRMNDAKCDPDGRLWAGTMAYDLTPGVAALYRLDGDCAVEVLGGVSISNGMGWSPDANRMYYVDSGLDRVDVFDFDAVTGSLSGRRALVTDVPAMPDGMTVDADGRLWVCFWGTSQVRCYEPDGALAEVLELPVTQVTSCAFGGSDLQDLFVTTSAYELTAADLRDEPLAGATFVVRPGARGQSPSVHRVGPAR